MGRWAKRTTAAVALFLLGALATESFGFLSDYTADSLADASDDPNILICAPLEQAEIQHVGQDGAVRGSAPYPVDNLAWVIIANDTQKMMSDIRAYFQFSGYGGRIPYISKAQAMTPTISGSRASSGEIEGNVLSLMVPELPPASVILTQVLFWEPVHTVSEIYYNDEILVDSYPPGCPVEEIDLQLRLAMDSFFSYAHEDCTKEGRKLDCPKPTFESGFVIYTDEREIGFQWNIKYGGEHFSPFDPEIALANTPELYNELLLDRKDPEEGAQ